MKARFVREFGIRTGPVLDRDYMVVKRTAVIEVTGDLRMYNPAPNRRRSLFDLTPNEQSREIGVVIFEPMPDDTPLSEGTDDPSAVYWLRPLDGAREYASVHAGFQPTSTTVRTSYRTSQDAR